jgi:hypothetical protein
LKKILFGIASLLGLVVVAGAIFLFLHDLESYQETANPCERACIQDSGGLAGCRKECASHPNSYGPNSYLPDAQPH